MLQLEAILKSSWMQNNAVGNKHAPLAKIGVKGNNLPYVTTEVRRLIRQRDFLRKEANKTGSNYLINKTNDLILNLTPENVTQHSRIE